MPSTAAAEIRHISFEVEDIRKARWYHDRFLGRLGFHRFADDPTYLGYSNGSQTFWLLQSNAPRIRRRPPTGDEEVIAEHVAFKVGSGAEVAKIQGDLAQQEIYPIFRCEEHPEFAPGYVSATWVDSDKIVLEVYSVPEPKKRAARAAHRRRTVRRGRRKR